MYNAVNICNRIRYIQNRTKRKRRRFHSVYNAVNICNRMR